MAYTKKDLALYGGPKAKSSPNIPMFPGGLEIGAEEKKEVLQVLDTHSGLTDCWINGDGKDLINFFHKNGGRSGDHL